MTSGAASRLRCLERNESLEERMIDKSVSELGEQSGKVGRTEKGMQLLVDSKSFGEVTRQRF